MSEDTTGQAGAGEGGQPTEEELRAAFEEQMRNIRVEDVVVQTAATLINLAARRLGLGAPPGEDASTQVDPAQARLAIDGVRALLPLCPEEQAAQLRDPLAQLQMAYTQVAEAAGGQAPSEGSGAAAGSEDAGGGREPGSDEGAEDEARAKARARIWTPPGS